MNDKLSPTPPIATSAASQPGSHQPGWTDPRVAAKSKLASATSVEVDPSLDLDTAGAQLTALRNQATAAAASGDFSTLQQLAVHAVALGVAAGQHAETLANAIAAKMTASGSLSPETSSPDAAPSPGARPDAKLTALGLKPEEIARLFAGPDGGGDTSATAATGGAVISGLHELAALNARASAVITDARSLLASMNQAIGTASPGGAGDIAPAAGAAEQGVTLNGLSQLLDQAESALTAKVYAIGQQIVGAPAATGGDESPRAASSLDLKT